MATPIRAFGYAVCAVILLIPLSSAIGGCGGASDSEGSSVRIDTVATRDLRATVEATGRIYPTESVSVTSDFSGRVVRLAVEEGEYVRRGQLLLQLDPTSLRAEVQRAQADLVAARSRATGVQADVAVAESRAAGARAEVERGRSELERTTRLVDRGLIPAADLNGAETRLAQAESAYSVAVAEVNRTRAAASRADVDRAGATLREASEQLKRATIRAPIEGRVTRLAIAEGETAVVGTMNNPGSLLLTIDNLDQVEARVRVSEVQLGRISLGNTASVSVDAYSGQEIVGRVVRIADSALDNSAEGALEYEVSILLEDVALDMRSGLSAVAEIVVAEKGGAVVVPIAALTTRRNGSSQGATEGVFVASNGVAVFRPVELGIISDQFAEVKSGVRIGDPVVTGPVELVQNISEGDLVSP